MAAKETLRRKLAMAVKTIHWSYAIFWSISSTQPKQGVLTWCDGYYNGDIKTRKTIQAEETEDEDDEDDEMGLQRTAQLRQLYESLSAASEMQHYEPQPRRPPTALSPEDLTDAEWYFLVCMTFEFTNGQGLPGRTMAKNTTSWLSNANLADSNVFSRSLLAKSASIQTVVCFPYLEGIVEFGVAEKVLEDESIVKQIKALIFDAPLQKVLELPRESCSNMLDHDDHFINNLDNILEYDQNQEQSWRFVDDDEEGEISFHHNNYSMGSSDCVSQNLASANGHGDVWSDDDDRYQCVLLRIFKNTPRLVLGHHFRNCDLKESAFVSWKSYDGIESNGSCSQFLLKSVLYKVPKMHENRLLWPPDEDLDQMKRFEDDDVKNIDHRFSVLSALVTSRGKVDKVSLLDDTIDYLKTLERKVEKLQSNKSYDTQEMTCDSYCNKRKASCDLKDLQEECFSDCITVSAIEKDVTIDIRCRWRDNMMVQVFDALSSLNLESYSVNSSTIDGILTLTIESKLTSCTTSTTKIRQALQRVIGNRY
ncbi:transcription factor EGL1-like [Bidens hawaiensis]|uniref:transcription factor EGL1-like n=1 Tax=Bidens hawaiensis TaxID=980011 RepID=UPI00404AA1C7